MNPGIVVSTGLPYLLLSTETVHILMGWVVLNDCTANFIDAFSALTLLVGRQEGHPACKKLE